MPVQIMPVRKVYSDGFVHVNGREMEVMIDTHAPYGKCLVPKLTSIDNNELYIRRRNSKDGLSSTSTDSCSTTCSLEANPFSNRARSVSRVSSRESIAASSHGLVRRAIVDRAEPTCELSARAQAITSAFFKLRKGGHVSRETTRAFSLDF
jgi:hypothetical protein